MKFSLSRKLYGLTGGILAIMIVLIALSFAGLTYSARNERGLGENVEQREAGMDSMIELGFAVELYKGYLIHNDQALVQQFHERTKKIKDRVEAYQKRSTDDAEKAAVVSALEILDTYDHMIENVVKAQAKKADIRTIDDFIGKGAGDQLREALQKIDDIATKNYETKRDRVKQNH